MPQRNQLDNCPRLTEILREQSREIVSEWEAELRSVPIARDLDHPALIDQVPAFLDEIASIAEELEQGLVRELPLQGFQIHTLGRLVGAFDLEQVAVELAILRDCIITRLWQRCTSHTDQLLELRILNQAIDSAVTSSIARYTEARDRTLRELDRVFTEAVERPELEYLLHSLLRALLDMATPDVDSVAVLLREGEVMRVRATAGLGLDRTFTLQVGEGFAGIIAAQGRPHALASASSDPLIANPALRAAGIRALYGVPLVDDDRAIGVIHMGSLTVDRFTIHDRRLLEFVASRATAVILQYMLRETAERTASQLRERETQLQTLADNIPQLAWMADRTGVMFWYNRRWFEYTGTTFEEVSGFGWQKVLHPDHLSCILEKRQRAVAGGEPWEDTIAIRGKDGRYRWFLTRAVPICDPVGNVVQWFGTNTDVTEQRFIAEATKLLSSSLNYRETLERLAHLAVPDLADWCVVDIIENEGPRRIAVAHADPAQEELARLWAEKNPPDWREPRGIAHVLRTGEPELISEVQDDLLVEVARDDEQLATLRACGLRSMIAVPLVAHGRTLGALALVTAESGRRYGTSDLELAAELGRRAGVAIENARLYREAQDAVRLREQILAIVSHDLRNPLSAIDLGAALALESTIDPQARAPLELVLRSSHRMQRMIGDLLDLARIQSGSLELVRKPQDAGDLLTDVLTMHRSIAQEKGITIVHECAIGGVVVQADRERIEQVFGNLLANAIKFCKPGDTIWVAGTRERDHVRLVVQDSGPGIPAHELQHVFEPYWSARDRTKEGLGLGLYISKGIIDAHGGEMWAESPPTGGARVVVRLPIAAP